LLLVVDCLDLVLGEGLPRLRYNFDHIVDLKIKRSTSKISFEVCQAKYRQKQDLAKRVKISSLGSIAYTG
jgi:hypothetical protein